MKFSTHIAILALAAVASTSSSSASSSSSSSLEQRHAPPVHRGLMRHLRRAVGVETTEAEPHYVNLQKRYSGRATFYNNEVSEGACGGYTSSSDYIVALNVAQYGNPNARSSWCGKKIQIHYGGKTETATVVDCCPTCPPGGLDMSKGLFGAFADFGAGIFQMSWSAGGSDDQEAKKTTSKKPKTTSTQPHTTHSTHSSTTSAASTTSSSSTTTSSTTSSSTSATDEASATPAAAGNLENLSEVMRGMMDLAQAVQKS